MAIDEAIYEAFREGRVGPTLRIYGWSPPGISLGYFQDIDSVLDIEQCSRHNMLFVRRITGGEAIFHDKEVTYSLVCSPEDLILPKSVKQSFKVLTGFLINAYRELGLDARFFCDSDRHFSDTESTGFCFATSEAYDVCVNGKKLGGNAQKRSRSVIFQHGSIPLDLDFDHASRFFKEDLSPLKKSVTALNDLVGRAVPFEEIQERLIESFKRTFQVEVTREDLSGDEVASMFHRMTDKYSQFFWSTCSREPAVDTDIV